MYNRSFVNNRAHKFKFSRASFRFLLIICLSLTILAYDVPYYDTAYLKTLSPIKCFVFSNVAALSYVTHYLTKDLPGLHFYF